MEQVKSRTDREELQAFYDMLQAAYQELQADNDRLGKQLYMRDKRDNQRTQFFTILDRVLARPSKLLSSSDKNTCTVILEILMLEKCEQRGIYKKVLLSEIHGRNGKTARTDSTIERLLNMQLFEREKGEHLDGEYWLALPDDFLARLMNIPTEFHRKWHAVYCPFCGRHVKAHSKSVGIVVLVGECGHTLKEPRGFKMDVSMDGIEKEDMTVSEAQKAIQELVKEYEAL